jgi:hypothetical protein
MDKKTVCTNWAEFEESHDKALFHAKGCHKLDDPKDLIEIIEDMSGLIRDMYDSANAMHNGAEAMEERLRLYRSAIESLGFKRDLTIPKV